MISDERIRELYDLAMYAKEEASLTIDTIIAHKVRDDEELEYVWEKIVENI